MSLRKMYRRLTARKSQSKRASLAPEVIKKEEESIFDPGTTKVKDSFLDMLDGESAKMTGALQNSANWPGIMAAAKEAPNKIREMEAAMGLKRPAGKIGEFSAGEFCFVNSDPQTVSFSKVSDPDEWVESAELKRKGRNLLRRGSR